jgi:GTP-binding protein HflX
VLLHVVDASSAVRLDQIDQVNEVLRGIGADNIRQILVFNKIDAVPELAARDEAVERDEYGNISRVFLSARTGQGLDALRAAIAEIATAETGEIDAGLPSVLAEFPEPHEASEATQSTQSESNAIHDTNAQPDDHRQAVERDDHKVPEHGH